MSASLFIQIVNVTNSETQEIKFFEAESWTIDTEKQLLTRIQDLMGIIRNFGKSLDIKIIAEVTDIESALFLIKKKTSNQIIINNQKLSIRELEILGLIMQGLTNNEIAERLFICYETVKSHRKNILHKTGAKNTAALINYYHQTFFEKP